MFIILQSPKNSSTMVTLLGQIKEHLPKVEIIGGIVDHDMFYTAEGGRYTHHQHPACAIMGKSTLHVF